MTGSTKDIKVVKKKQIVKHECRVFIGPSGLLSAHIIVWGRITVQCMGNLHGCEGTIIAAKMFVHLLEKHMLAYRVIFIFE